MVAPQQIIKKKYKGQGFYILHNKTVSLQDVSTLGWVWGFVFGYCVN
jgi:hypothetical protein